MDAESAGKPAGMRLDTWEAILSRLAKVGEAEPESAKISLLMELLVHLRLLGQDPCIPDRRTAKSDIEKIHATIESATRTSLAAVSDPSPVFIYYAREVIKKLPVRQGAEDMIEMIRAEAEAFEESRLADDPFRGFAGDLRKEVHRRLSPRVIARYLDPYLDLVLRGERDNLARQGYVAVAAAFEPGDEDRSFIDLAVDLKERLEYLWDFEAGDLASVKTHLASNIPAFERCLLGDEVRGFLSMLTPEYLTVPHRELDLLSRLASFKQTLKDSYRESRIGLYDQLLLDLSLGRLIFLLANDLTNNHFAKVTPRNMRDALGIVQELLEISSIKGLAIGDVAGYQDDLARLRQSAVYDFPAAKRCLGSICGELQNYVHEDIIEPLGEVLNRALEAYEVPTSRLTSIRTRFFNNFIRRTQIHVLSEFAERVEGAVDRELERQSGELRIFGFSGQSAGDHSPDDLDCVACTWERPRDGIRHSLGGKGNSILDMASLGLRVPPAFILGNTLFRSRSMGEPLRPELTPIIEGKLEELERLCERQLGDPERPLILAVRSGAAISMPGVMTTILNVGLTPPVRKALYRRRGEELVQSLYSRFLRNCIQGIEICSGPDSSSAEAGALRAAPKAGIPELEAQLSAAFGAAFLNDPREQLERCVRLVADSGVSAVARMYSSGLRSREGRETAVTVQRVVFGNLDERSLSGVLLTRNPITGENRIFGEFKRMAQGEEVVSGDAGTQPIEAIDAELAEELETTKDRLVSRYAHDLDLEFTVEAGALYLLQARAAKLGAFAQLEADRDYLARGIISVAEFSRRLERLEMANTCIALPRPDIVSRWSPPLTVGVPISGGVVSGTLVVTRDRLKEAESRRESAIFFAQNTKPTDFDVLNSASAIVTANPGRTSHAAITAMSMNKTCIVGCEDIEIQESEKAVIFHGSVIRAPGRRLLREGERITVDGNTGAVYAGTAPISDFFLPISTVRASIQGCEEALPAAHAVKALIEEKLNDLRRETSFHRLSLSRLESLEGMRVLVRVDANVPAEAPPDEFAQRAALCAPTIARILSLGGTPIVCSHLGDPGSVPDSRLSREGIYEQFSLGPFAEALGRVLNADVKFHKGSIGASGLLVSRSSLAKGAVNVLENLRFAAGEKDNDEIFSRSLAELCDGWYVNDAFNVCHRRHASIVGVTRFAGRKLAGLLVERELKCLEALIERPARPFLAVFGGPELEAYLGVMSALIARVDSMHILGSGRIDAWIEEQAPLYGDKIRIVPEAGADALPAALKADAERAGSLLWSAPAGLGAAAPSPRALALARAAGRGTFVVLCSESDKRFSGHDGSGPFISSGPRAFLEYLERLSLPGITALDPDLT